MNIAYVSMYNSDDIRHWSGSIYFIGKALRDSGCKLTPVHNLAYVPSFFSKLKFRYNSALGIKNEFEREKSVLKNYSAQVKRKISTETDAIFSPSTLPIAYLKSAKPIALYLDATFEAMVKFYPEFSKFSKASIRRYNEIENRAFENASLLFFASDWAAQSAINDYNVPPEKVFVVPFGANLEAAPKEHDAAAYSLQKEKNIIKLLFIGIDWERKGGKKLMDIAFELQARKIEVEVHIVGPKEYPLENKFSFVHFHGFLNKHDKADSSKLTQLLRSCHFFIMLSESECYGLVYCEANAFGIPVIGSNVGGVATIIKNNNNGLLVEPYTTCQNIAEWISNNFQDQNYQKLSRQSYKIFKDKLNWQVAGSEMKRIMEEKISVSKQA